MILLILNTLVAAQIEMGEAVSIPPLTPLPNGFMATLSVTLAGNKPTKLNLNLRLEGPGLTGGSLLEAVNPDPSLWRLQNLSPEKIVQEGSKKIIQSEYTLEFLKPQTTVAPEIRAVLRTEKGRPLPLIWRKWLEPDFAPLPIPAKGSLAQSADLIPGLEFFILGIIALCCLLLIWNPGMRKREIKNKEMQIDELCKRIVSAAAKDRVRLAQELNGLVRNKIKENLKAGIESLTVKEIQSLCETKLENAEKETLIRLLFWSEELIYGSGKGINNEIPPIQKFDLSI